MVEREDENRAIHLAPGSRGEWSVRTGIESVGVWVYTSD